MLRAPALLLRQLAHLFFRDHPPLDGLLHGLNDELVSQTCGRDVGNGEGRGGDG